MSSDYDNLVDRAGTLRLRVDVLEAEVKRLRAERDEARQIAENLRFELETQPLAPLYPLPWQEDQHNEQ